MNADALLLYSYLMRQDIPFTRFCHPAYRDRTQWIQSLKKSKLEPFFPMCRVFVNTTGDFLLTLGTDAETVPPLESYVPAEPAELQQICEILHCQPHTLSPMGLLFDQEHLCRMQADNTLQQSKLLCFSPCSDTSSVLMTPEAFFQQFLPAFQREPILRKR